MRISRAIYGLAVATTVMLCASVLRADEFNKLTYLTFSGPVQVPGVVLDSGTYMFKLADPESGRRVIQIWDKEGTKLYTTLLSIPDSKLEPKDDPVVLFAERPSGEPPAIKSWFYVGETSGYEFVYPKDQAMKIARANHEPVLAQSSPVSSDADVATRTGSSVARVNESGQFEEQQQRAARNNEDNVARNADQSAQASQTAQPAPAPPPPATATRNRSDRTATGSQARAVGTSGELPKTASNAPLIQLMAGLSLVAAIGVRQLRKRAAASRA